jgi:fatty acid desaturase
MEQVFVRADLLGKGRLQPLSKRSDAQGWLKAGSHFAAILATGSVLCFGRLTIWLLPVFLLHGVLINFLYAGQHELSHSTVFKTRKLNEIFGRLIGFILITPRDADQIQHFAHHRHTQIWRMDGELYRAPFTLRSYLLRLSGVEYWSSNINTLLLYALGRVDEPYVDSSSRALVIREARLHLLGYAAIAGVSAATGTLLPVLLLWIVPMLLTKPAHQLQNTIEHVGLPHTSDIVENTRSVKTNAFMRWICWNMQYHTAHHAFPSVPCYRLRELHHEIFTARGVTPPTMTYLGFQKAIITALWKKDEVLYPEDQAWITPETELPAAEPVVAAS